MLMLVSFLMVALVQVFGALVLLVLRLRRRLLRLLLRLRRSMVIVRWRLVHIRRWHLIRWCPVII